MKSEDLKSNIKELRVAQGLTQRDLAIALDTTESSVRNWERGRVGLESFYMCARLCEVLKCSPSELVAVLEKKITA